MRAAGCFYGDYLLSSIHCYSPAPREALLLRLPCGNSSTESHKTLRDVCVRDGPQVTGFVRHCYHVGECVTSPSLYHEAVRNGLPASADQSGLPSTRPRVCDGYPWHRPLDASFPHQRARLVPPRVPLLHLAAVLRSATESTPSHM